MATRDDIFEVRIGRMGRDKAPIQGPMQGAIGRAKRAGSSAAKAAKSSGLRAHFRKGGATPAHGFSGAQRRVVVKARIVAHGAGKAAPLETHVAYLAREGRANAHAGAGARGGYSRVSAPSPPRSR
jgi:hypothetical protein